MYCVFLSLYYFVIPYLSSLGLSVCLSIHLYLSIYVATVFLTRPSDSWKVSWKIIKIIRPWLSPTWFYLIQKQRCHFGAMLPMLFEFLAGLPILSHPLGEPGEPGEAGEAGPPFWWVPPVSQSIAKLDGK